eukprot:gb/GFBE01003715.1/.p1 GENE.gb/GFBE01003715.1/~~gb/GFBE01003715.1/.p1  ORF type:complete len:249 (+),score=25.38 gb/GFBE01003715.1/:1-747(+)
MSAHALSDELLARRLQLEEMGFTGPTRLRPPPPQQQTVQAQCPRCQAQNQFTAAYSPEPITVQCGSCPNQFQVQMPAPQRMDVRLCQHCGCLNQYPLPRIGQPFPEVRCGTCSHISRRRGTVTENDRRHADLFAATGGVGPMVSVSIGGQRRTVPLAMLRALMAQEGRNNAAADGDIAALPSTKVADVASLGEQNCCTVCIEDFKDGDDLKTLPCLHMFHAQCIETWLKRDNSCPSCRAPIGRRAGSS